MRLTTTREEGHAHGIKILVHGPAGAGKTRLCATAPDHEKTIIISAEAGLLSIRDTDITVAVVKTIDDMREALAYLQSEDGKHYTWICIDSLSEIAEQCLAHEKATNTNGQRAYGEMADTMFKLIRAFRDLPNRNVIMTAKTERINDEGRLIWGPMLPGKQLSQGIAYLFDLVLAMRSERADDGQIRRFLQTANDGYYEAKDRSGALNAAEPPNLETIAKKILAHDKEGEN